MLWRKVSLGFLQEVQGSLFGHQIVLVIIGIEHSRVRLQQGRPRYLHKPAEFADCEPYFAWVFIGSVHRYDLHVCLDIDNRLCLCETIPPFFCLVIDLHNSLGRFVIQLFLSCPLAKLFICDIELVNTPSVLYLFCLLLFPTSLIFSFYLIALCSNLLHFAFRLGFLASTQWDILMRGLHFHFRRLVLSVVDSLIVFFIFKVEVIAAVSTRFFWQCFSTCIYLIFCICLLRGATSLGRLGLTLFLLFLLICFKEVQTVLQIFDRFPCGFIGGVTLPLDLVLSHKPIQHRIIVTSTGDGPVCEYEFDLELIWLFHANLAIISQQARSPINLIDQFFKQKLLCTWQHIHFNHWRTLTGPAAPSSSGGF